MGRTDTNYYDDDRDIDPRKGMKKEKNRKKRHRTKNVLNDFSKMTPEELELMNDYYSEEFEEDW